MRGDFIAKFIKSIIDFGVDFYQPFTWTPVYYKGIHISGPDYRKYHGGIRNLQHRGIVKNVGKILGSSTLMTL